MTDPNRRLLATRLDRDGRILLPAAARRALGVKSGDALAVQIESGAVRLSSFASSVAAARSKLKRALGAVPPGELAQGLVALRRSELWRI